MINDGSYVYLKKNKVQEELKDTINPTVIKYKLQLDADPKSKGN